MNLAERVNSHILVLDADSIVSIIGAHYNVEPSKKKDILSMGVEERTKEQLTELFDLVDRESVFKRVDSFLFSIFRYTGCTHYHGLLGACGSRCFRYDIATTTPYKKSRKDKPFWMGYWKKVINQYLIDKYNFEEYSQIEADDAVGIYVTHYIDEGINYTIGAIDKDLMQIPGKHFNFKHNKFDEDVSELGGARTLLKQVVKGDTIDCIPGLAGYGPVKIKKEFSILDTMTDRAEMFRFVQNKFLENNAMNFEEQFRLVYMLREPAYDFVEFKEPNKVPTKMSTREEFCSPSEDIFTIR